MSAEEFVPADGDLAALRKAALSCHGCDLYRDATRTVFGEGPEDARILAVGEQPGDIEDRQGRPFVGPAGKILDRALAEAGLDRSRMYLTNAVKHFKHRPAERGKRRIHQTPDRTEIVACRPWLVAEFRVIRPRQVIVLGATAAKALLGPSFRVTKQHGVPLPWPDSAQRPEDFPGEEGAVVVATIHPSAVLRARSAEERDAMLGGMVADLRALHD
jgi:DNA polymerase